jgi:hypothetical protein
MRIRNGSLIGTRIQLGVKEGEEEVYFVAKTLGGGGKNVNSSKQTEDYHLLMLSSSDEEEEEEDEPKKKRQLHFRGRPVKNRGFPLEEEPILDFLASPAIRCRVINCVLLHLPKRTLF